MPLTLVSAVLIGLASAGLLSSIMLPAARMGLSPMPEPLALAFATRLLGPVPPWVGLLFHAAYVTFWAAIYVTLFERRTLLNALWLGAVLWLVVLGFFFPLVGWGFMGLRIGPPLIGASLVPHILFALFVWALTWLLFRNTRLAPPREAPG